MRMILSTMVRAWLILAVLWPQVGHAQDESGRRVAGFQTETVAIRNATIHVAPGEVLDGGTILISRGLISAVGTDVEIPRGAQVIEGEGLVVYAGFVDAAAVHLIDEDKVPAPPAGRPVEFERYSLAALPPDHHRGLWPHIEVLDFLNLSTNQQEAYRQQGITLLHVVRPEPILGGQSGVLSLSGQPRREAVLRSRVYQSLQLASPSRPRVNTVQGYPVTIMGAVAHFRQRALDALYLEEQIRLYDQHAPGVQRPEEDHVLQAMWPMLHGEQPVLVEADERDAIHRGLDCMEEHGLRGVIFGGRETARALDRLRETEAAVILDVNFEDKPRIEAPRRNSPPPTPDATPETDDSPQFDPLPTDMQVPVRVQEERLELWQERVGTALVLHEAGVPFAFSSRGLNNRAEELLQRVRTIIEEGLPAEVALDGLTRSPARLLGLEDRLGTIAPGKLAHLVVLNGPFENRRSVTRWVIVDGRVFEYHADARPLSAEPSENPATPESPGAADPADFSGTWLVTLSAGMEPMTTATLLLEQSAEGWQGTFSSNSGDGRIAQAEVSGQTIRFQVRIGVGDRAFIISWEGELTEQEGQTILQGTVSTPFGRPGEWQARRQMPPAGDSSDAAEPPSEEAAPDEPVRNPVVITLETGEESAPPAENEPPAASLDWPTEIPADRRDRGVTTGGNVLIHAGWVWTGAGETLTGVSIRIRDGKITEIGPDLAPEPGVVEIDAREWFVMPGMIDTHSHIMIGGGVNESSQSIVCEVSIRDVVMTQTVEEYRALAGGLTTARLLHGSANVIGGQDAVVKLRYGASARDHVLWDAPQGVKFALGENVKHESGRFPATRMGVEATLQRAFFEALDYRRTWQEYRRDSRQLAEGALPLLPPRRDLRLDTLVNILNQEAFIHCHCYRADEILMLLRTADSLGIRIQSLQHVLEGYKIAPEIVAHGASCSTFSDWWAYKIEAYDATPYNTTLLNAAGANVVVKSDDAELIRHMNLEAAKSLRYGNMPIDDALSMVTINAARELRLDDRIGSIEIGKDGDLAIFNGHPLSPFSRCEWTIIDGEVYFQRAHQPTAMTAQGQQRSQTPPSFELAPPEVRQRVLELPPARPGSFAITGAAIYPVDGPVIPTGVVLVSDGMIEAVGPDVEIPEGYVVIHADGLQVYPGLIDAGTTLGITEIRQVGKTNDHSETGGFQPDVRAGTAVNVDSELIPVARAGGVTLALLRPTGGVITGQCSLLQTAGWTSPEMVIQNEAGLSINWPRGESLQNDLRAFFAQARRYDEARQAESEGGQRVLRDPRYEEMRPYLHGRRRVYIEAHSRQEIAQAVNFAQEQGLRLVITGGTDAWKLAEELSLRRIPVIVGPTMRPPVEPWDPFDATYANPGRLYEAGVNFCIRSDDASNSRNVSFEAAIAVAYGLPEAQALRAITLNAARILGVGNRYGSITPGKVANLVICDGSPLHQTTQIRGVFVGGVPYPPESRQTRFYERYRQRLESAVPVAPALSSEESE